MAETSSNPGKKEMSVSNQIKTGLSEILSEHEAKLVADWVKEQSAVPSHGGRRSRSPSFARSARSSSDCFGRPWKHESGGNIESPGWSDVREMLEHLSRSRSVQGFSPSETASFIFSLKKPLFTHLRREVSGDGQALADETWSTNELLDKLGLYTTEVYQKAREEIISRQQQEMLELSTPVVKLWDGILALPMIGTLDSARTQVVMETPAPEDRRDRARASRSSTSRACRRSTRSRPSTC